MTLFTSILPVKGADLATFGLIDASVFTRRVKQTRNMVGCADYPSTRKSLASHTVDYMYNNWSPPLRGRHIWLSFQYRRSNEARNERHQVWRVGGHFDLVPLRSACE